MPRIKNTVRKCRVKTGSATPSTISQKSNRSNALISLDRMSSAELIDVFSAATAIEKGITYVPVSSAKVSSMTRKYRSSTPAARKRMLQSISRTIVERNASENPATPEMIAKLKKTFG